MPQRFQRQRGKGWKMPAGAIYCGRPSVFGNPFREYGRGVATVPLRVAGRWQVYAVQGFGDEVDTFEQWLRDGLGEQWLKVWELKNRRSHLLYHLPELRGRDLVCWCGLERRCHVDVVLRLANQESA